MNVLIVGTSIVPSGGGGFVACGGLLANMFAWTGGSGVGDSRRRGRVVGVADGSGTTVGVRGGISAVGIGVSAISPPQANAKTVMTLITNITRFFFMSPV